MGNRLYVGHLSADANADSLRVAFSAFGEVTDIRLVVDRESGQRRGFGFVTMGTAAAAAEAKAKMHGRELDGRTLKVHDAEARQNRGAFGRAPGGS